MEKLHRNRQSDQSLIIAAHKAVASFKSFIAKHNRRPDDAPGTPPATTAAARNYDAVARSSASLHSQAAAASRPVTVVHTNSYLPTVNLMDAKARQAQSMSAQASGGAGIRQRPLAGQKPSPRAQPYNSLTMPSPLVRREAPGGAGLPLPIGSSTVPSRAQSGVTARPRASDPHEGSFAFGLRPPSHEISTQYIIKLLNLPPER